MEVHSALWQLHKAIDDVLTIRNTSDAAKLIIDFEYFSELDHLQRYGKRWEDRVYGRPPFGVHRYRDVLINLMADFWEGLGGNVGWGGPFTRFLAEVMTALKMGDQTPDSVRGVIRKRKNIFKGKTTKVVNKHSTQPVDLIEGRHPMLAKIKLLQDNKSNT